MRSVVTVIYLYLYILLPILHICQDVLQGKLVLEYNWGAQREKKRYILVFMNTAAINYFD